jgi:hypothetical protein
MSVAVTYGRIACRWPSPGGQHPCASGRRLRLRFERQGTTRPSPKAHGSRADAGKHYGKWPRTGEPIGVLIAVIWPSRSPTVTAERRVAGVPEAIIPYCGSTCRSSSRTSWARWCSRAPKAVRPPGHGIKIGWDLDD